jgi:N6-L-threonylcarbamoyladenine synthase
MVVKVIGIETSCDETAAAVVEDGRKILSNVVLSQIDLHQEFGGVVPEVAARSHIESILPVIQKALADAKTTWGKIDAIAVTHGPGLPGALLVGTMTARTLAWVKKKPLYGVNHVLAHVYANFLLPKPPEFPLLALIISGGHTELVLFGGHFDYQLLGQTQDDAVGEAFDKVAKLLGLDYPGGPAIAEAATSGNPQAFDLPRVYTEGKYDFSFSGLKTATLRHLQKLLGKPFDFPSFKIAPLLNKQQVADTAAVFQQTAINYLVAKTQAAYQQHQPKDLVIAGGVAANQLLRQQLKDSLPADINYAPIELCTDNAAMIAALGYFQANPPAGKPRPADPLKLESNPSLAL